MGESGNLSLRSEVEALRRELAELRGQVDQQGGRRPLQVAPRNVRLVKTATSGTYPDPTYLTGVYANTFEFVNADYRFTKSVGDNTPTVKERSASPQGIGQFPYESGVSYPWIPEGQFCLALEQPSGHTALIPLREKSFVGRVYADVTGRDETNIATVPYSLPCPTVTVRPHHLVYDGSNWNLEPAYQDSFPITARNTTGRKLFAGQYVICQLEEATGQFVVTEALSGHNNRRVCAGCSGVSSDGALTLTQTNTDNNDSDLEVYADGTGFTVNPTTEKFRGADFWWTATVQRQTIVQHATQWTAQYWDLTATGFDTYQRGRASRLYAPLTEPNVTSQSDYDTISGVGRVGAISSARQIRFTLAEGKSGGLTVAGYLFSLTVFAESWSFGDGYQ